MRQATSSGCAAEVRPVLPGGLSMLWESIDETRALQQRFGFDGLTAVAEWVTQLLQESWGITVHDCPRMVISGANAVVWADTVRDRLVVKWSAAADRFEALAATADLLSHLGRRGFPIAAPIPTSLGQDRLTVDGPIGPLSIVVQPEVNGDWLDPTDDAAVRAAGAALAQLHLELAGYADQRLTTKPRIEVSTQGIQRWLTDGDRGLAPGASTRLRQLLSELPDLDHEPQLVHGDFRAANILTRGSAIVGVLDFDEVASGQPVGDLAFSSVYLSTLFTDWGPTPAAVRQQFRAGYESVRALSPSEVRWCDAMVLWLGIQAIPGEDDPAGWASAV